MLYDKIGINNHVLITPSHKKTYRLENMPVMTIGVHPHDMSRSQMEYPIYGLVHDHGRMQLRRKLVNRIKLGIMKNIEIPCIDHLGWMKGLCP